jgi:hypothetical protein
MTTATGPTTPLFPFTVAYAQAIAVYLPDWEGGPYRDADGVVARDDACTLTYVGSDPDLQGARIDGYTGRYGQTPGTVRWSTRLYVPHGAHGQTSITTYLPYDHQQQSWPGSTINVSLKKRHTQVAQELKKRLLAYYLPAWKYTVERLREEDAQKDADLALAQELATILGCHVWPGRNGKTPSVSSKPVHEIRLEYGQAYVQQGFYLTPQQAREFCALIASWRQEKA